MAQLSKLFGDFFEDGNRSDDSDSYDDSSEVNSPGNPIWDGSDVHYNPFGTDTTLPDPNEVNPD